MQTLRASNASLAIGTSTFFQFLLVRSLERSIFVIGKTLSIPWPPTYDQSQFLFCVLHVKSIGPPTATAALQRISMAFHNAKTCRRCSCRRKSCLRRKADQPRRVKCFIPHAQFLLIPRAGALYHQRKSKSFVQNEPQFELDGNDDELMPNEVAFNSEDLRIMRDSIERMRQELSRGLQNLLELRALMKEVASQQEYCEDVR
ncbi:unnamed protein product [Peronospora belbahrii]|uniref:Uncharacterized protein n=1 Tax=Peronospora belbahrii TaxID=622444 RepID=A0AAU9L129_9STRA|nr:unnamed protein product [Peronospora belbahrii]CAH0513768.1 unnamed protein product [Peronospora belbahrii]